MLRGKEIKARLRRGEVVTSIMLRFPDANLAEMLAIQGVDLIIIDNEHYPFDPETMIQVIRASHAGGACCMVRLPNAEPARIARRLWPRHDPSGICPDIQRKHLCSPPD